MSAFDSLSAPALPMAVQDSYAPAVDFAEEEASRNRNTTKLDEEEDRKPAAKVFPEAGTIEVDDDEDEMDRKPAAKVATHEDDYNLALQLQLEEDDRAARKREWEETEMSSSSTGRAVQLVQELLQLHAKLEDPKFPIKPLAIDDLVFIAERFIKTQEEFARDGKPTTVDIGYHYTNPENIDRIKTDGLLSKQERMESQIVSNYNGSAYGDGIYTAPDPSLFLGRYGTSGLMTARLQGVVRPPRVTEAHDSVFVEQRDITVLKTCGQCLPFVHFNAEMVERFRPDSTGNAWLFTYHQHMQQLIDKYFNNNEFTTVQPFRDYMGSMSPKRRRQWGQPTTSLPPLPAPIPFTPFPTAVPGMPQLTAPALPSTYPATAASPSGPVPLSQLSTGWVNSLLANYFNPAAPVATLSVPPASAAATLPAAATPAVAQDTPNASALMNAPIPNDKIFCNAFGIPAAPPTVFQPIVETFVAPATRSGNAEGFLYYHMKTGNFTILSEECSVCLEPLMRNKEHGYIASLLSCHHRFHKRCIDNFMDKGGEACPLCRKDLRPRPTMPSGTMTITEAGNYFVIRYSFQGGLQLTYHENPGASYNATNRTAYVPNTNEGEELLKRLRCAFTHGLTFKIGTSQTTGIANSIVWGSIPHKSRLFGGGPYGFPDDKYVADCNAALDKLGIPGAWKLFKS